MNTCYDTMRHMMDERLMDKMDMFAVHVMDDHKCCYDTMTHMMDEHSSAPDPALDAAASSTRSIADGDAVPTPDRHNDAYDYDG